MKNMIKGLLISVAMTALSVCAFAQVSIGGTVPSLPVSSNPVSAGASTGPGSAMAPNQCISSSLTTVDFVFDTTTNPATYTFNYTCTSIMNGNLQPVVSNPLDGSGTCTPSQSSVDCKKAALAKAGNQCNTYCASNQ